MSRVRDRRCAISTYGKTCALHTLTRAAPFVKGRVQKIVRNFQARDTTNSWTASDITSLQSNSAPNIRKLSPSGCVLEMTC